MKKLSSNTEKGIAAIITLTAIFALLSVIARYLHTDFEILQQVYLRVFAALLMALVVFSKHLRWRVIVKLHSREWSVLAFRAITTYAVGVTLVSLAANMTLIGNVSFIAALPFVPLLGFLFLKEKVTWWKLAFIFASLLGVTMLSVHDFSDLLSWSKGDIIAIVATLSFALAYIARKWHGDILNNQEITTLTLGLGTFFVFITSLLFGQGLPSLNISAAVWLVVIAGGVLNIANQFLINYGFQHLDAVRAGNLLNLEAA